MKKNKIFIAVLAAVMLLCGCTACGPHDCQRDVVLIGETCEIYKDRVIHSIVTYNSCSFETLKENEEVLVMENITIQPMKPLIVTDDDVLLCVGYESNDLGEYNRHTSIEENIRINGYNIFDVELTEEVEYSFCYKIPYEKNGVAYFEAVGIILLVFHSKFFEL